MPGVELSAEFSLEVREIEDLKGNTKEDRDIIQTLRNYLKGDQKIHRTRKSLLDMITSRSRRHGTHGAFEVIAESVLSGQTQGTVPPSRDATSSIHNPPPAFLLLSLRSHILTHFFLNLPGCDTIELPQKGMQVDLNSISINGAAVYQLAFQFLRDLWRDEVKLVSSSSNWRTGEPFVATAVELFSHVIVNGTRFGACTSHRGKGTSFAYIDHREAVRIQYIIFANHERRDTTLAPLSTTFAIVERFTNDDIPKMPWMNREVIFLLITQG